MAIIVRTSPCPQEQQELFCTQLPILNRQEAQELTQFFNQQNESCYFRDVGNNRWGLKKEGSDFSMKEHVSFTSNGQTSWERVTSSYASYQGIDKIKPIIHKALACMAQEMGWKDECRSMAVTFMQHQITQPTKEIEFHRDDSHYTLVCLLDDEAQWTGGEFHFRPDTAEEGAFFTKIPMIGQGILFSNQGTQHSITPIKPTSDRATRTIMTIHDYGLISPRRAFFEWFLNFVKTLLNLIYKGESYVKRYL